MTAATVYTQPGCRSCKRVIKAFEDAGLEVEVVDISLPGFEDARTYVTEVLGAKSVPVVVADDYPPIIGYQPDEVQALALALTSNERN